MRAFNNSATSIRRRGDVRARTAPNVAAVGSDVTYRDDTSGSVHTISLVMPRDADARVRRISVLAPIGAALIGRAEGEVVGVDLPAGRSRWLFIVSVRPGAAAEPDAAAIAPAPDSRTPLATGASPA